MPCEHKYVYLRKDVEQSNSAQTNCMHYFYDLFYCEKCLSYRKIKTMEGNGHVEVSYLPHLPA